MLVETWQRGRQAESGAIVAAHLRCDRPGDESHQRLGQKALRAKIVWWSALPMLLAFPVPAAAQDIAPATPVTVTAGPDEIVTFSADRVVYDSDADLVTASGEVRMNREGNYLAADKVVWDRKTGQVRASGNVVIVTPEGDKLIGGDIQLTDTLRDGTVDNLVVVLESGGRIAASHGARVNGVST